MKKSICEIDCEQCELKNNCKGCFETNGHPFDGECVIVKCCHNKGNKTCKECLHTKCNLKEELINEINSLKINGLDIVTDLNALIGSIVNLEYKLPNGKKIKLLNDNDIYFGNQLQKNNSDRCFGVIANESIILVCEYGINGIDPEIIIYKKRNI